VNESLRVVATLLMPVLWLALTINVLARWRAGDPVSWRAWLYVTLLLVFIPALRIASWVVGVDALLAWPPIQMLELYYSVTELVLFFSLIAEGIHHRSPIPVLFAAFFVMIPAAEISSWSPLDQLVWNALVTIAGVDGLVHATAIALATGKQLSHDWVQRYTKHRLRA
jgi:hypothetical protein